MTYDPNLGRLPDPTTFPAGPGFISQSMVDNSPGMLHVLNSGGTIGVKFKGNYWSIDIVYPELLYNEPGAPELISFIYGLQGGFNNFYIQLPTHANPALGAFANPQDTLGRVSIGNTANELLVDFTGITGTLSIGDMLKISNSHKIYLVTGVSGSTNATRILLNSDVVDPQTLPTASLEPNDVRFRVRLTGNPPKLKLNANGLYDSINLSMRENIL